MERIKTSIIVFGVVSGCLILAVIGYAGMGSGHHGSHHGSMDGVSERYGDNHGYGAYHGSYFNLHHQDLDNAHGYDQLYGHKSRSPYKRQNDRNEDHEMKNENATDHFPDNALQRREGSAFGH
ncbi:hypothetical protein KQH27_00230 [bacterium]|nr:hypothetical protein [bacterium]